MLLTKSLPMAVFCVVLLFSGCGVTSAQDDIQRLYFAVLDAQLYALETGEYRTMDRVFELKRVGDESDRYLVDLLDYNLGAGAAETLWEFIVEGGHRFVPTLKTKRATNLTCPTRYISICVDSVEVRNQRIDELLAAIRK